MQTGKTQAKECIMSIFALNKLLKDDIKFSIPMCLLIGPYNHEKKMAIKRDC